MAKMPQDGHCWPSWEGDPYNLGDKHLGQQFRVFLPKTANMAKVFPPRSPARPPYKTEASLWKSYFATLLHFSEATPPGSKNLANCQTRSGSKDVFIR